MSGSQPLTVRGSQWTSIWGNRRGNSRNDSAVVWVPQHRSVVRTLHVPVEVGARMTSHRAEVGLPVWCRLYTPVTPTRHPDATPRPSPVRATESWGTGPENGGLWDRRSIRRSCPKFWCVLNVKTFRIATSPGSSESRYINIRTGVHRPHLWTSRSQEAEPPRREDARVTSTSTQSLDQFSLR